MSERSRAFLVFAVLTCAAAFGCTVFVSCDGGEAASGTGRTAATTGETPAAQRGASVEPLPATPAPRDTPPAEEKLPGDAAIDLAMRSRALGSQEVRYVIDGWLKGYGGVVNSLGWFARRVGDEDTYVVSFSFAGESLQRGWFFEVDVPARRVTNVSGRSELEKKYELYECPASEYEAAILGKKTAPGSNAGSQEPDQPLCVAA